MSWWGSLYFQDMMVESNLSLSLDSLHLMILLIQLWITLLVGGTLTLTMLTPWFYQTKQEWIMLEITWTILPAMMLLCLGIPSLELLYFQEALFVSPDLIVKITGHQWYWEYAMPELGINFDSFTESENLFRLSDVSSRLILPTLNNIQLLITSHDVIHSFALPSMAIKADANPGRLNSVSMNQKFPGVYVGQCSELCGALHSNMAIVVEFSDTLMFSNWVEMQNKD